MFEELDDQNFDCIAVGIGGVFIPESINIIECCQDPDNLNVIYIRCSIAGVYAYTPRVTITWSGGSQDISDLLIYNYRGIGVETLPINTSCSSATVLLAYNVGSVISDFASLASVDITVQMVGQPTGVFSAGIQTAGIFVSSNPIATAALVKGVTPQPYKLYFDPVTNQLKIQYSNLGGTACLCAINCTTPTVDDFSLTVCENEIQEVTVDATSIFGDPTNVLITFQDSIGNLSNINVHAVATLVPAAPMALRMASPTCINVTIPFISATGTMIDQSKVKYQVLRYENNPGNAVVWKDWTAKSWKTLFDRNIRTGRTYGYAVRFKGEFGEISSLSDWTVIQT